MQRFAVIAALLLPCAFGQAQTSIKITMPDNTSCTYPTGQISSNTTPGQLQTTATNTGSGAGCGSGTGINPPVSFGPASPLTPSSTTLVSNTNGETASLSFRAFNATNCTGSIVGAGATFTGGTNGITFCSLTGLSCAGAQNVSVSLPYNSSTTTSNSYTVTASCTGPGSLTPVTSPPASITVQPYLPTASCPAIPIAGGGNFTQVTGNVNLQYSGHPTASVNMTDFSSIYHSSAWPASLNWIALFSLRKDGYISAGFKPPANYFTASNAPANLYGEYYVSETLYSAPVSMTISTSCGDFSAPGQGSTVVPGCYLNNGVSKSFIAWEIQGPGRTCVLSGDTQYYLNIINADIGNVTPGGGSATQTCGSPSCIDPISNGPGNWGTYVPN